MPSSLLQETRLRAQDSGFDLFGVVDAARFDACQPKEQRIATLLPGSGVAIVIGSGGTREAIVAGPGLVGLCQVLQTGRRRVLVAEPGRCALSFARLAEAAGLGTVSPVTGLLLHPTYGPWVRVHAALLVQGNPFGVIRDAAITDEFQPCCRCPQTCLEEVEAPVTACPIGIEHKNGAATPLPQMVALQSSPLQRIRLTAMRFVPRFLRF